MSSTHVTAPAFWNGDKFVLADATLFVNQLKRAKFGSGEALVIRVEREEDAKRYAQLRLWFALIREMSEFTGYDVKEMHELAKIAVREPDWPDSLSAFTKDQMSAAITNVLRWSAETLGLALEAA